MSKSVKKESQNSTQGLSEEQKSVKLEEKAKRKAYFESQLKPKLKDKEKVSKAERRAKQELERALKANQSRVQSDANVICEALSKTKITSDIKSKVQLSSEKTTPRIPIDKTDGNIAVVNISNNLENKQLIDKSVKSTTKPLTTTTTTSSGLVKKGQLFPHIPKRNNDITILSNELNVNNSAIHPIVIRVGFQINRNIIKGSNARCVAMLMAFKKVIEDYITPPSKELARDLESVIDSYVKFLAKCRPLSISMSNAVKFLKLTFSRIPAETNDSKAKYELSDSIDNFIEEIIYAQRAIADAAITKIRNDSDVILTFGCSLIIKHVLYNAAKKGKKFRVVVVDSRPRFDGREMLKYLLKHDIPATYIFINAVSYVMKEVTKVLLGAHSLLANGYVMSHIGSSQIALVANAYNVPVLVCCETYKFSERVHTDSFVHNELGDSTDFLNSLTSSGKSQIEQNVKELNTLDLLYDVTPHEFVSVVITEKGVLPCTSAPAVLRVRETK